MRPDSIRARSCGNDDRPLGHVGLVGGKEREGEKRGEESFSELI